MEMIECIEKKFKENYHETCHTCVNGYKGCSPLILKNCYEVASDKYKPIFENNRGCQHCLSYYNGFMFALYGGEMPCLRYYEDVDKNISMKTLICGNCDKCHKGMVYCSTLYFFISGYYEGLNMIIGYE